MEYIKKIVMMEEFQKIAIPILVSIVTALLVRLRKVIVKLGFDCESENMLEELIVKAEKISNSGTEKKEIVLKEFMLWAESHNLKFLEKDVINRIAKICKLAKNVNVVKKEKNLFKGEL